MIFKKDSLAFLQEQKKFAFDINYSDPPYALGSEIYIKPDGKFDYKKATDFMNKWDMPTGEYWEKWFDESFRTLKHGGYCVMFGIDRQLPMFQYYAIKAGFQVRQSMYWYFITNFPKASDLEKNLEKNSKSREMGLSDKYKGYKYSISPLKQTCETIMVFQKPYKTGSCLHDTLAYENGDDTCACFAWNIDGGRVPMSESDKNMLDAKSSKNPTDNYNGKDHQKYGDFALNIATPPNEHGRYPSQTFCDSEVAERLDKQSDSNDSGCSKILHKCDYENDEMDLYVYVPKVSKNERNAGCSESGKNNHPTLKPINLSYRVLTLFKTPNLQKIVYPFSGVQSEVIGGYKAGFTDFSGCELNAEYVDIGNVRFEYWKDKPFNEKSKVIETKKEVKLKNKPQQDNQILTDNNVQFKLL